MPNYQVNATQLTPGKHVLIRGKLGYARLTKLIEGAELVASDKRRVENNKQPVNTPHTTAQLTESTVIPVDPQNATIEDHFVQERRYLSKKKPETGLNYDIDNKSSTLPIIAIPNPNGDGTFIQDNSGRELAPGLDVTLVLRVYKPKNYANCGLSLDQVLVNEPVRYYASGGVDTNELAARGIVFSGNVQAVKAGEGSSPVDHQPTADAPVGTTVVNGFALPSEDLSAAPAAAQGFNAAPAAAPAFNGAQGGFAAAPAPGFNAAPTVVPVATPQAQAPAGPAAESPEQELARVKAELAAARGQDSAFGAPAPAAQTAAPWDDAAQMTPGISYQR